MKFWLILAISIFLFSTYSIGAFIVFDGWECHSKNKGYEVIYSPFKGCFIKTNNKLIMTDIYRTFSFENKKV